MQLCYNNYRIVCVEGINVLEYYNDANKEMVFLNYSKIVSDPKKFKDVTISQMIEEVKKQFSYKNFLYYLCSSKELKFLKMILDKKFDEDDYLDYMSEIRTLNSKFIFNSDDLTIFPEQMENVKEALKKFDKDGASSDHYILPIAILRMLGYLPLDAFKTLGFNGGSDMSQKEIDESFEYFISCPLFIFNTYIYEKDGVDYICYADFINIIEEIDEERKKYDNIEPVDLNKDLVEDMFYYGFPIHNKKVKRMYDFINEYIPYIMDYVEEARALNDYSVVERFLKDDKAGKIIRDGLEYCPSCALYGISPNSYAKALENNKES